MALSNTYFTAVSFGDLTWTCSTPVFYSRTVERILIGSLAAHKTLTFSTHTEYIAEKHGGHCHCAVFSAPYGHSHFATYRRPAVVMNVPGPCTASRQNDAAASHSCHFNTVLYPRSYSQCQLPLNHSRRDITGAASSLHNYHKIFAVTALSSLHFCRRVNIYIMLYNVPL
jgi:hypothetical protein